MFLILHASTCILSLQLWIYANCVINAIGILNDLQHFDYNLTWWAIIWPYSSHPFIFLDKVEWFTIAFSCTIWNDVLTIVIKVITLMSSIFLYHWCQLALSGSWNHCHILNDCIESIYSHPSILCSVFSITQPCSLMSRMRSGDRVNL